MYDVPVLRYLSTWVFQTTTLDLNTLKYILISMSKYGRSRYYMYVLVGTAVLFVVLYGQVLKI